ncbi:MAG: cytochrome bc complex cytochrome b subunit [Okeania sp. SIO2D1]|nr:cytochrome bc complex cytochrome b subunit [Okeania sp. SIO2C9]NES69688.1 cytochrome bc complex cytochrome b subunit [Okeania sp. SIO2D1]
MINNINSTLSLRRLATIVAISILTLTIISALSGTLLAFNYQPTAGGAYKSLEMITSQIPFGWIIRDLHNYAGNSIIILGLIQIIIMFLSRQFRSSWLIAWISGIFLVLVAIGLGWTAMILDWSQEGFWRFSIELSTVETIPFIGSLLRYILTGGNGISTMTVLRQYTLHSYLLPVPAIALAFTHLGGLIWQSVQDQKNQSDNNEQQEAGQGFNASAS